MLITKIVQLSNDFEKRASDYHGEVKKSRIDYSYTDGRNTYYYFEFELHNKEKYQGVVRQSAEEKFSVDEIFKIKDGKDFIFHRDYSGQKKFLAKGFEEICDLELVPSANLAEVSETAIAVVKKHLLARESKLSLSERKQVFYLVSRGEWELWKTVKDWGSEVGGKLRSLIPGLDDEETTSSKKDSEKPGEKSEEKRERESIFRSDNSLFSSIRNTFQSQVKPESNGKFTEEFAPPSELEGKLRGYKRVADSEVPQDVKAKAPSMLSQNFWSTKYVRSDADDVWYLLLVEFHKDDHAGGGVRWHKGVTVFYPIDGKGEDRGDYSGILTTNSGESAPTPLAGQVDFKQKDIESYLQNLPRAVSAGEINPLNVQVLENAIDDIGQKENGSVANTGEEISKYFGRLGIYLPKEKGLPWCAAACSYWMSPVPGIRGSVSANELSIQFGDKLVTRDDFPSKESPEFSNVFMPGNIVFIQKDGRISHVGVLKSIDLDSGQITTIDGNSGRDGKQVAVMNRSISTVAAIGLISEIGGRSVKKEKSTLNRLYEMFS